MTGELIVTSLLLGIGLAMDACAVSMANGLNEPQMKLGKMSLIAVTFGLFQGVMPLLGWICVHTMVEKFETLGKFVPYVSLLLLAYVGGKMLYDGIKQKQDDDKVTKKVTLGVLFVQAIATSIDALSVGFAIESYDSTWATLCATIIAVVTIAICFGALFVGKKFGDKLGSKAQILGGVILICIGLEIFVKGVFFS